MQRRSVRRFKDDPVEDYKIKAMVESGMQAPSAINQQPWEFIVVKNKTLLKELSEVSKGAWPLKDAPLGIVTLMRDTGNKANMRPQDMAACTQNILLEAISQSLGGVWIGAYPLEKRISKIKSILDVCEGLTPFNMIALGYPDDSEDKPIKKRFDNTRIHWRD
jgi:nitroreductase